MSFTSFQEQQFSRWSGDELLSDDDDMADEEYIPNSESEDDDDDDEEDSAASIPFMSSQLKAAQIQVKPLIPEFGTSNGSDTSIPFVPSTSKGWLPLEDHIIPNAADTSDSVEKKKPENEAELRDQDLTQLTMTKKNDCLW